MSILFDNNASGTLSVQAEIVDTTLTLQTNEGLLFPTPTGSNFFQTTLEDASGNIEIVQCTSKSSDELTVTRAQENTTAKVFPVGSKVELRMTAATMDEFIQRSGDQMTGTLDMNDQDLTDPVIQGGRSLGTPMRGADDGTANQIVVPSAGADPTIGGAAIIYVGNDGAYVQTSRTITGGEGILGSSLGDLSANRTVDLDVPGLATMSGSALLGADSSVVYDDAASAHKRIPYQQAGVPVYAHGTTAKTLVDSEMNSYWVVSNALTINFDFDTGVGELGNVIIIQQGGAGVVDLSGGSATINSVYTNKTTNGLNSVIVMVCTNTSGPTAWTMYGDGQ